MDRRWNRDRAVEGESRFHLVQAVELCAHTLYDVIAAVEEGFAVDFPGPVGFMNQRGWHAVNPRRVRVLRLAAREEARPDYEPREFELRFKPEDVVVLGVESLGGLVRLTEASKRLRFGRPNMRGRAGGCTWAGDWSRGTER